MKVNSNASLSGRKFCRNAEIDMWRFFASLIIMWHHLYTTGMDSSYYRFHDGDLFVEFFFLITGYYTAKHFKSNPIVNLPLEEKAKTVIKYTFKKFKDIIGLCACATIVQYVLYITSKNSGGVDKLKNIANLPADLLLITNLYQRPLVTSFWYLSTVLLMLPFVSLIMASLDKIVQALVSAAGIGIYYGFVLPHIFEPLNLAKTSGEDLLRAFVCMYAGCFLCEAADFLAYRVKDIRAKVALFFIGESLLLFITVSAFIEHSTSIHAVMFFILALICMFSNNLYMNNGIPYYLGRISLYIYIWNWSVGTFVGQYFGELDTYSIKIIYLVITVILSILSEKFISIIKNSEKAVLKFVFGFDGFSSEKYNNSDFSAVQSR